MSLVGRCSGREDALQKINKLSEVGIDRQKKIIRILEESPEETIAQLSNLQKGNYGEMKMDIFYTSWDMIEVVWTGQQI